MTKKSVSLGLLTLLALVILSGYGQVVFANPLPPPPILNIYIRSDGTIDPPTVPIQRSGNVYTFTNDIRNATIEIQRNNTILDGAGHMLCGNGEEWNTALNLKDANKILIKNLNITNYTYSTHLTNSSNITILNNTMLTAWNIKIESSENNQVVGNNITGQDTGFGYGIQIIRSSNNLIVANNFKDTGNAIVIALSKNNIFYYNNFLKMTDNENDVVGYIEEDNFEKWSNNSEGNYWSNYNGADANHDGIGDTPYVIDQKRQDPYPLMTPYNITNINIQINGPTLTDENQQNQTILIAAGTLVAAITAGVCITVYFKKRHH